MGPGPNRIEFVYVPYADERNGIQNGNVGALVVSATLANGIGAGDEITIILDNF